MDTIPKLDAKINLTSQTGTSDRDPSQLPYNPSNKFGSPSNKYRISIIDQDRHHSTMADVLVEDSDDPDSSIQDGDPKFDIEVEKALSDPSKSRTLRCKPNFSYSQK